MEEPPVPTSSRTAQPAASKKDVARMLTAVGTTMVETWMGAQKVDGWSWRGMGPEGFLAPRGRPRRPGPGAGAVRSTATGAGPGGHG